MCNYLFNSNFSFSPFVSSIQCDALQHSIYISACNQSPVEETISIAYYTDEKKEKKKNKSLVISQWKNEKSCKGNVTDEVIQPYEILLKDMKVKAEFKIKLVMVGRS